MQLDAVALLSIIMLVQAKQDHYGDICAIEAASYPADEAASPEGIAMRYE